MRELRSTRAGAATLVLVLCGCGGDVSQKGAIRDGGAGGGMVRLDDAPAAASGGKDANPFPFNATCRNVGCGYVDIENVITASTCCTATARCGVELQPADRLGPIAAGCVELEQRSGPDQTCPAATLENKLGSFTLVGCCRATGTCGMIANIAPLPNFGCVDPAAWGLEPGGPCRADPTCNDGVIDFGETDRDCGGRSCGACSADEGCKVDVDCTTGFCDAGTCRVPVCGDGIRNGEESDVDCGTGCLPCSEGKRCRTNAECLSSSCVSSICR